MRSAITKRKAAKKSAKKKSQQPMVKIEFASFGKRVTQEELRGISAAQVAMEMIVEGVMDEFPQLALLGIELFPCGPNCRECRAGA